MKFRDARIGEALTIKDESSPVWKSILRKVDEQTASGDDGDLVPMDADCEVEVLETPDLSHAIWVNHDDEWKLVLRWTTPREKDPKWASLSPANDGSFKAGTSEPADRRARALLASGLHARGELDRAVEVYDELINESEDASLLNNRGAARAARGDTAEAITDYTRALALDTRLAQAYSNRGNAFTKLKRYDDAILDYDRALDLAGDVAPIYCNRGLTRKMLGDLPGSLEDFDLALTLDDTFGPGYLARGGVRAISGDIRGAVADLEQFVRLSPGAPQSKDVRLAISRLRSALTEANDTNP